jgi:hypothetical protein
VAPCTQIHSTDQLAFHPRKKQLTTTNTLVDWKPRRTFRLATAAVFLSGVAALAACQTQQQPVTQPEDNLAAAGFIIRPANTPERKAMLSRLPPNRFVKRKKGDIIHYIYADLLVGGCLYVGPPLTPLGSTATCHLCRQSIGAALELRVEDNGVGFDPEALDPGRYGIVGLREQAELIGAELRMDSKPNEGTTMCVDEVIADSV